MRKLFFVGAICLALAACDGGTDLPAPVPTLPGGAVDAGKPTSLTVDCETVTEGHPAHCAIAIHGGNGRAVTVVWNATTGISGSATITTKAGTTFEVPTVDDDQVNGTRTIIVSAKAVSGTTGAGATGTITVLDNDVAAPPPPVQTCADGSVIAADATCPAPPPPAAPLVIGGRAKALSACPSLTNTADVLTLGSVYTVVGFASPQPIGTADLNITGQEIVVLNDDTHRGDGWFGIFVPVECVAGL